MGESMEEMFDIVSPERLQGFSDAVFATAATLLIIPIRRFELEADETLREGLYRRLPQLSAFLVAFLVICSIWQYTNIRFKIVAKVDDVIVALTLAFLLFVTFMPFSLTLLEFYGNYQIAILINCGLVFILEVLECSIFVYACHTPMVLNEIFQQLDSNEIRSKKRQVYAKTFFGCLLISVAALLGMYSTLAALIVFGCIPILPLFRRIVNSNCISCQNPAHQSPIDLVTRQIDKDRIECFSDAAIAIIATILVLDLTTEDFPNKQEVDKNGLSKVLFKMGKMFISYISTIMTVVILWFVHHSLLNHIKRFSGLMVFFNHVFLAFLAGTPFMMTLLNKFQGVSANEQAAVQLSSIIMFSAGLMHVIILVVALWNKNFALHSWAIPDRMLSSKPNPHIYLLLKTLIIPCISLTTFLISLNSMYTAYVIFQISVFLYPLLFVALKIKFACHCLTRKQKKNGYDDISLGIGENPPPDQPINESDNYEANNYESSSNYFTPSSSTQSNKSNTASETLLMLSKTRAEKL